MLAIVSKVGNQSRLENVSVWTVPGLMTPGHRIAVGTLNEVSQRLGRRLAGMCSHCFCGFSVKILMAFPLYQTPCSPRLYPWSLVKITIVLSSSASVLSKWSKRPTFRSTLFTEARYSRVCCFTLVTFKFGKSVDLFRSDFVGEFLGVRYHWGIVESHWWCDRLPTADSYIITPY